MGRTLGFFESFPFFRMGSRPWAFVGPVALTGVFCFQSDISTLIRVSLIVVPDTYRRSSPASDESPSRTRSWLRCRRRPTAMVELGAWAVSRLSRPEVT